MSEIGTEDGQGTLQSPGLSAPAEKKKVEKEKAKSSTDKPAKSGTDSRSAKASTDARIEELDQKWSDRFDWLEALLLARTLDRSHDQPSRLLRWQLFTLSL